MVPYERSHPRIPVSISANVTVTTGPGAVARAEKVANLSLGGIFIEMGDPPPFGTEMTLEIKFDGHPSTVRCKGFVMWSTKNHPAAEAGRDGVGVRLTGLSIADMKFLADYIEARAR